ncbi:hypothetical protein, partial [Endozoicomonas sp. SESOKO4]|uniref:hypothetical protein n=1 Tax=Endozoicomonas sp. SESOKO4 TaxID=2828745 RepID=UPI0035A15585
MSKQDKKALVPELRFQQEDGSDYPDWKITKLKSLATRQTARNRNETITRALTNSAAEGVIDQRDYFDKDIAVKGNLAGYSVVDKGDYVYNPRVSTIAPVGPISRNNLGKGVISPLYTVFRFNDQQDRFYEQYFKSTHWHSYMRTVSNVGARHDRMSLSNDDFMSMPLPVPNINEREKVTDCLSSIDDLITSQTKKLEALKAHKKRLMQQLFPAEGEAVPKLRFPEFQNLEEWEEKPLCNLTTYVDYRGRSPSKKEKGVFLVTAKNIKQGYIDYDSSK